MSFENETNWFGLSAQRYKDSKSSRKSRLFGVGGDELKTLANSCRKYRTQGSGDWDFPDLNPIEMMFAKLKTLLRKSDESSRDATWRRVGEVHKAFSPHECPAYLRHAGFASI
jgi:hypothetical protein